MAEDMETCIQMCCDKDDCEMAFMPGKHCYGVDCFSQEHCEITTVKPSNLTVRIAEVRPIIVNPAKDQIAGKRVLFQRTLKSFHLKATKNICINAHFQKYHST